MEGRPVTDGNSGEGTGQGTGMGTEMWASCGTPASPHPRASVPSSVRGGWDRRSHPGRAEQGRPSEDLRRARLLGRVGARATSGFSVWGFYCLNHGMTGVQLRVMILSPGPTTLLAVRGCPQMGATGPLLFFCFVFFF